MWGVCGAIICVTGLAVDGVLYATDTDPMPMAGCSTGAAFATTPCSCCTWLVGVCHFSIPSFHVDDADIEI